MTTIYLAKQDENWDKVTDSVCVLRTGTNRLWMSYEPLTNRTRFTATKGLDVITQMDYLLWTGQNFLWDYPERFAPRFRDKCNQWRFYHDKILSQMRLRVYETIFTKENK